MGNWLKYYTVLYGEEGQSKVEKSYCLFNENKYIHTRYNDITICDVYANE